MIELCDRVFAIPATEEPLSADVGVICGDSGTYLFDVGASDGARDEILSLPAPLTAILSHFHPDHTKNISRLPLSCCYAGAETVRHIGMGTLVQEAFTITDGVRLSVFPLPSSHAKGSLGVEVDGKIAFLGDGLYACRKGGKTVYNAQLLSEQIKLLRALQADLFCASHYPEPVREKTDVLSELEAILAKRRQNEAYIEIGE